MEGRAQIEAALRTVLSRGWCVRDVQNTIDRLMEINISTSDTIDDKRVERELAEMDLREIGGKSLPESSILKRASHLQGPKVLQVVYVRDIYQSNIEVSCKSNRRLLMFCLTDGNSEVIAIEYAPILSITEEIVPGTKVCLGNRIPVHSGLLCLESNMITVIGGHVQSLYEEWQMSRKYSGFSRSYLKLSQHSVGPPPFQKLQVGSYSYDKLQSSSSSSSFETSLHPKTESPAGDDAVRASPIQGHQRGQIPDSDANIPIDGARAESAKGRVDDKPTCSSSRPKEVSDAVPVQNQAAAQKLLQRMSKPERDERPSLRGRGAKHRGKQEEPAVLTLDEWERKKSTICAMNKLGMDQVNHDEEIARQLQRQLDLEDQNVSRSYGSEAEKIRSSMFNFERQERQTEGRQGFKGRGRGRRRFG